MNVHDAIVDQVLNALRLPTPITDGPIEEDLDLDSIGEDEAEAVNVALTISDPQDAQLIDMPTDWTSQLTVECHARADARTPSAGRASRRLHARAYARLSVDPSLNGLLYYLGQPSLRIDGRPGATRRGVCIGIYEMRHRTDPASLEQPT